MRIQFRTLAVLGAMVLGLTAVPARAEEVARVKVPFPFVVHGRTLPAGQYEVRADDQDPSLLMLVGVNGTKAHAIVNTIGEYGRDPAGDNPALTFVRRENQYQLSAVWEASDYAREIPIR